MRLPLTPKIRPVSPVQWSIRPAVNGLTFSGYSWAVDVQQVQSPKYLAILALVACLILGVGWLVRPREVQNAPAPLPTENELAQLARRPEQRSLDSITQYFAETADQADVSLVQLPELGVSGVSWANNTIVTAPLRRHDLGTLTVRWPFGEARGRLTVWGPGLPLAAVRAEGLSGLGTARIAPSPPAPGGWVLAVWRSGGERRFAQGSYLQSSAVTCGLMPVQEIQSSLGLSRSMSGGGLFDADGALLAVILPCGNRFAAVAAESIDAILKESDTDKQRVVARFGLAFGQLGEDELSYFKVDHGVLVREVWIGHRGEEAGLMPGDVVLDLNATPVTTPRDLEAQLAHLGDPAVMLTVRRGAKTITIAVPSALRGDGQGAGGSGGVAWESPPPGYGVDAVRPGSRAARAGLQPGDRLVRMNYVEPRSLAQVRRVLSSDTGPRMLLEVERVDRRLALLW